MKNLKTIRLLIAFLLFAGITLSLSPVLSSPTKPKAQTPPTEVVSQFEADTPLCYMRSANGEILDLSNLCNDEAPSTEIIPVTRNNEPYDSAKISQFDRELYGD